MADTTVNRLVSQANMESLFAETLQKSDYTSLSSDFQGPQLGRGVDKRASGVVQWELLGVL